MRTFLALLTLLPAQALAFDYDEAVSGDLPGDENHPFFLSELDLGTNTLSGTVDPVQDTVTFRVPRGLQVVSARVEITSYQSLGNDGFVRFIEGSPFGVYSSQRFTGDTSFDMPLTGLTDEFGFTAASVGPSGALYHYRLILETASTCMGSSILWDEAADGELGSDENHPQWLAALAPGHHTMCGVVDPVQDTVAWELPYGRTVTNAELVVSDYASLGQDGYTRFFAPTPFFVYADLFLSGDGRYTLDTSGFAGETEVGFSASSVGPSGALYAYQLELDIAAGPTLAFSGFPTAGAANNVVAGPFDPTNPITLLGSSSPGSTVAPVCGLTVDLTSPRALGTVRANASGDAVFRVNLPAALRGRTVYVQAVDTRGCVLTPPLGVTLR